MSVRHLLAASEVLARSGSSGLTAGRFWSLVGVAVGLVGVVVGVRALIRGAGRRSAVTALVAGVVGLGIGGLVVVAAEAGPGTGYGIVGGFLALAVGLIAAALGAVVLKRSLRPDRPLDGWCRCLPPAENGLTEITESRLQSTPRIRWSAGDVPRFVERGTSPTLPGLERAQSAKSVSPTNPPGSVPGGMTNTAEPIGVVHTLSASNSASLRCTGRNWTSISRW